MNQSSKTLQIANILAFIFMIAINTLAVTLPLGGRETGAISDMYPNLFVPAGYAFSIWSLIYTTLLIFIIIQAKGLFSKSQSAPEYVTTIGWWFAISCLANGGWMISWHYLQLGLSVLLMILLLFSLITVYNRLKIGLSQPTAPFFSRLPFSIYFGWITVALIANITAFLVSIGWNGFGISEIAWMIVMLFIATGITTFLFWQRKDIAYIGVIIWAFVAILSKRTALGTPDEAIILTILYICLGTIGIIILGRFLLFNRLLKAT